MAITARAIPNQLLFERCSLKSSIPEVVVRTITPILTIGKTCELSKIPEDKASTKKNSVK